MFFAESEVNSALNCPSCEARYDVPKNLPCGQAICQFCESKLSKKFECSFCLKNHEVPDEGFPISIVINKMLTIKASEVHRSDQVTNLKRSLKEVEKKINELSLSIENGVDCIKEHCIELRNHVQLSTESTVNEINDLSESMITKIDVYEKERIKEYKELKNDKNEFAKIVEEMKQFYNQWNDYLKKYVINDQDVLNANALATELKHKATEEKLKLDDYNFKGNYLNYEKNINKIDKNILGVLRFSKPFNFEKLEKLSLADLFTDYSYDLKIAILENENYLVSYQNINGYYILKVIDNNRTILATKLSFYCQNNRYNNNTGTATYVCFASSQNTILISYISSYNGYQYIQTLDENLVEINRQQAQQNYQCNSMSLNNSIAVCFTNGLSSNNLNIYSQNCHLIKSIGQVSYPTNPFYFPTNIIQLENKNSKYYWLNGTSFNIVCETSGVILKSVVTNANKFHINSTNNIILVSYESKLLIYFDKDGNKLNEEKLNNFPDNFTAFFDSKDKIHFFDVSKLEIYYQSN
jgi:hypothetical protein